MPAIGKQIRFWDQIGHKYRFGIVHSHNIENFIVKANGIFFPVFPSDEWRLI